MALNAERRIAVPVAAERGQDGPDSLPSWQCVATGRRCYLSATRLTRHAGERNDAAPALTRLVAPQPSVRGEPALCAHRHRCLAGERLPFPMERNQLQGVVSSRGVAISGRVRGRVSVSHGQRVRR